MTLNKILLLGELGTKTPFTSEFKSNQFYSAVKAASNGQWLFTLQAMGIAPRFLDGRNHPCPACGGHDRFQFTVRGYGSEWGRFSCRSMPEQGGDGFRLIQHIFNLSFSDSFMAVAKVLGMITNSGYYSVPAVPLMQHQPSSAPMYDRTPKLQAVFDACSTLSPDNYAGRYLINRGLDWNHLPSAQSSPLRHCSALDYWHTVDDKPQRLVTTPALIARLSKPDGSLAGIHRIYLDQAARKLELQYGAAPELLPNKKLQLVHEGAFKGAACRLFPLGKNARLALAEGIETALAVHRMTGLPAWACISTSGLKAFVVPDGVREIIIYADNDRPDHKERNAGKDAAYILAKRLTANGYKVSILLPPIAGTDWLDVMNTAIKTGANING